MKKKNFFKGILSVALTLTMLLNFNVPAVAEELETESLRFEKVDNSVIDSNLLLDDAKVTEAVPETHDANEVVRVSIVLKENSVIDEGYSTKDILENSNALKHMNKVKNNQKKLEKEIAKAAKKNVKVKRNLSIVANVISAEVTYSDIEKIETVEGVKEVVIETQYLPCTDEVTSDAPLMAVTSETMTGAAQSWAEGYTGSGARIAIIDTGLDIDHQSFNNDAFLYSLTKDAVTVDDGKNNNGNNKNKDKEKTNNGNNKNKDKEKTNNGNGKDKKQETTTVDVLAQYNLLGKEELTKALPYLNAYNNVGGNLTAEDLIISDKIPFGFNYVDSNLNVRHIYDTQGEHGSHVAGIATANRYLKVGDKFVDSASEVGVVGNAPDAQVLVMKVFGAGGGAYDSDYMAAIEDAIVLGCDSANLSLGSGNAGLATSKTYQEILDKLVLSDTVVVMSAGNSGAWAEMTTYGDLYSDGVNFDTAGSPGSFTNSLGVASVDNIGSYGNSILVDGERIGYNESNGYGNEPFVTLANGSSAEYDYVFIDGVGEDSDFDGLDVSGKIVFVRRGSISFFEKANAGAKRGAIATIVYNNQPGSIAMNLTGYEYTAPCVSVSQAAGAKILAASTAEGNAYVGKLTVDTVKGVLVEDYDHYTMSSFSSWGVPGNLSMKPEIAAPGGNIYSVNGSNDAGGGVDQYELMSGTSMAAPQITGLTAVLKRYIEINKLSVSGLTDRALAQSLLMSTATPMVDANGNYYSVLQQGAGLGNVNDAMHANSYITMNSDATVSAKDGKVKVELGDDPARTGVYSFSFNLNNLTGSNVTYKLSADVFTQAIAMDEDLAFMLGDTMEVPATVTFTVNGKKATSVDVKKNKNATVKVTIALDEETKQFFNEYFEAGTYVEAYVFAKPTNGTSAHSIPVLGFYGNWTDSSMFDLGSYIDYKFGLEDRAPYLYEKNKTNGNAFTVNFGDGSGEYNFGANLYASETVYHPEFASLNNENGDSIKSIYYALIRNAGNMAVRITDKNTGDVYANASLGQQYGAYYYVNGQTWRNTSSKVNLNWKGTDANGNKLPEGTSVEISLVAAPEYYCDAEGNFDVSKLGKGAFFSTSLTIDNTAPEMEAIADGESGSLYVFGVDNVGIASVMLFAENGKTLIGRAAVGSNEVAAKLGSNLDADVYLVRLIDYAGNTSTYKVFMNVEPTSKVDEVVLDVTSVVLMKNNSIAINASVSPANVIDESVTWASSDEAVAVVDANGIVTAVGVGECTVTATSVADPEKSATCSVEVIEIAQQLNGVVWDEEGQVWFSEFNTANLPNYTKLTTASAKLPINNLVTDENGTVYATDIDTDNGVSNLYTVDTSTFELSLVGASQIAYTEMAAAPHLGGVLLATYFNYIVMVDPTTGDYLGAFNYLNDGELVGIAYAGSIFNTNYGQYIDLYYLLDSNGNLYNEAFINLNGSYYYFLGADGALMGSTGITCDTPYFQSMYFNGDYTYVTSFNESTNNVALYAIDTENSGKIYRLGEFADGVWPVAGLSELAVSDAASNNAAKFAEVEVNANAVMTTPAVHELNVRK